MVLGDADWLADRNATEPGTLCRRFSVPSHRETAALRDQLRAKGVSVWTCARIQR